MPRLCPLLSVALLLALSATALAVASAGCGQAPPYPLGKSTSVSISSGGRSRNFLVYLASNYTSSSARPVVILLHGGLTTADSAESMFKFDPVSEARNLVLLYPNGYSKSWNAGNCCAPATTAGVDDVQFVSDMLDLVESQLCVDTDRCAMCSCMLFILFLIFS